jgi:hypothetical protein
MRGKGSKPRSADTGRPGVLSAAGLPKFIGTSREAARAKHQRHEVLGLSGAMGTSFSEMAD